MAQTDPSTLFAEFWKQFPSPLTPDSMKAMADSLGKGFSFFPAGAPEPNAPLSHATAQFRDLVEACLELSNKLAPSGSALLSDTVTAELLQKILDPREWLQATGLVDEATRKLTDAPKLADLWQVEGKYLAVVRAWQDARAANIEHSGHIVGAWAKAASEFTAGLKEKIDSGAVSSRSDLVNAWVEIANKHLLDVQSSDAYLATQRLMLKTSTDLHLAQRELTEYYSDIFGVPTRAEVDDLSRMVADLRRELRSRSRD